MSLRARLILVFTLIVTAGFYYLTNWLLNDLRPRYLESVEEALVDHVEVLAAFVVSDLEQGQIKTEALQQIFTGVYQRKLNAKIYGYDKDKVDLRVYVTDPIGIVLFDSKGLDEGRDYSLWRNIILTAEGKYGARTSHEDKFSPNTSTLHVSAPIRYQDKIIGVLTVAKPTTSINQFIASAEPKIMVASVVAALTVILFGFLFSVWITRPIQQLQAFARSVQKGQKAALPKLGKNEIGELGLAFEDMRETLEGKKYVENYVHALTHELKSPIAAIQAASELLQDGVSETDQKRFFANIASETQRMQLLVNHLLDLATLENRRALQNVERVDLLGLLQQAVKDARGLIEQKKLQVQITGSSQFLLCERFLIEQALRNLLQNAIDFSPREGAIHWQLSLQDEGVRLQITDQGPGFPDFALSQAFERFFSLPRPETGRKSTGLGLSFVKQIIELHYGKITLANLASGGACVSFVLPLRPFS